MSKRVVTSITVSIVILVAGGVVAWVAATYGYRDATSASSSVAPDVVSEQSQASQALEAKKLASGRYEVYSEASRQDNNYDTTILFFHAPWCPECRAFDEEIKKSGVPDGVQILKVDYDTNQDLRKHYGVTVQTSFVRVNNDGEKQAAWVGYGKTKSVDVIIENTK